MKPTVLITGASSGIGAVYADRFARRGHDLVVVARDTARLDAIARGLHDRTGVRVDVLTADLSSRTDLAQVEARLLDDRRIGILVNNAGLSLPGGFVDQSGADLQRLLDVNVVALARLANAAATRFVQEGAGDIVNVGSVLGVAPELGMSAYAGTKAFVLTFSQALQLELGPRGVYVQVVLPAATRTEIWERSGRDIDQVPGVMAVDDLVDAALVGFDRREAVTIPPLPDADQWAAFETARKAMLPNFRHSQPAARYRSLASAAASGPG